jgi:hypothetical protein
MKARDRLKQALNHEVPDRLPADFGSSPVTGIHVSVVYKLRQFYALDKPGTPVKVVEPFQMLGEVADDLKDIMGADIANLEGKGTFFGFPKEGWKEWELRDGTPVLVPGLFNIDKNPDGSVYQYANGNRNFPPSAVMPAKGFFFDSIVRQKPLMEENLDPRDNTEEFTLLSDTELEDLKIKANDIFNNTDYGIHGVVASSGFGDIAFVPGPMLPDPKGIRDVEEWYISTLTRKKFLEKVFEIQASVAIENYKKVYNSIGNKINVVYITGTDFGTQDRLFSSVQSYREIFKPFHKKINDWIHSNTDWKCFIHSCGSIVELVPDLIDAGFDILNPVQISAKNMDPARLKKEFGKDIVFWGGGVDTQKTLAYGSVKEVKDETNRLINIFSEDGGFIFATVHNIQANVPVENVTAMVETIQKYR